MNRPKRHLVDKFFDDFSPQNLPIWLRTRKDPSSLVPGSVLAISEYVDKDDRLIKLSRWKISRIVSHGVNEDGFKFTRVVCTCLETTRLRQAMNLVFDSKQVWFTLADQYLELSLPESLCQIRIPADLDVSDIQMPAYEDLEPAEPSTSSPVPTNIHEFDYNKQQQAALDVIQKVIGDWKDVPLFERQGIGNEVAEVIQKVYSGIRSVLMDTLPDQLRSEPNKLDFTPVQSEMDINFRRLKKFFYKEYINKPFYAEHFPDPLISIVSSLAELTEVQWRIAYNDI